jgi:hypothetical protein
MRYFIFFLALIYFIFKFLFDKIYYTLIPNYLVIDYNDYVNFSSNYVYNYKELLDNEILNYVNGISFKLLSLKELKNNNIIDLISKKELAINPKFWITYLSNDIKSNDINTTFIYTNDSYYLDSIYSILNRLFPNKVYKLGLVIKVDVDYDYISSLEIFPLKEVEYYRLKNKTIVWRVSSYFYQLNKLDFIRNNDIIIFNGSFISGYPFYLKDLKEFFINKNLIFGVLEYYNVKNIQRGSKELANLLPLENKIKVFSTLTIKDKSPNSIINSVDLAFNERNCKLIFYRFNDNLDFRQNIDLIKDISKNILKINNHIYKNKEFNKNYNLIFYLKLIGILGLIIFIIYSFASINYYYDYLVSQGYNVSNRLFFILSILGLFMFIFSFIFKIKFIFNILVLLFSSFIIAVFIYREIFEKLIDQNMKFNFILVYFKLILYLILFALFIQSVILAFDINNNLNLYLGIDKVSGIKLILILPIVLSIFMVFNYREIRYWLLSRMKVMDFIVILTLVGLGGFYLLRSGNTGFTLPFENEIRNILDTIFIARPRFKEFLIGNPILLSLLYFVYLKINSPNVIGNSVFRIIQFLFVFSFITFSDIIDTFLHIHSFVIYGVIRTITAALLGLIVFYILFLILDKTKIVKFK